MSIVKYFKRNANTVKFRATDGKRKDVCLLAKGEKLHSIQTKLILVFLVPVLLIIALGILSYSKSSKGLIESYESSTLSTMNYMVKYLNFGLKTISEKADTISNNDVLVNYYNGLYKRDAMRRRNDSR